jgi:5-amino-6-(5-phosphoribosylamino)uracil reductase
VTDRPYVLLSCAMSIDGHIDDSSPERLLLSNAEDFDRVDAVRATCDAILVGAATVRRDDPRLLIRSEARRQDRVARGLPPHLLKVTLTSSGDLSPSSNFFTAGATSKIVYAATPAAGKLASLLEGTADVIDAGDPIDLHRLLDDLATRGVHRLIVEGGGAVHTQFLRSGLADELHLAVAPIFVGDPTAPRFVSGDGLPTHRMSLTEVRRIGDVALLRYLLT